MLELEFHCFVTPNEIRTLISIMHSSSLSHVLLFVTLWTGDRQAPLSMGLSRQEYWSG